MISNSLCHDIPPLIECEGSHMVPVVWTVNLPFQTNVERERGQRGGGGGRGEDWKSGTREESGEEE